MWLICELVLTIYFGTEGQKQYAAKLQDSMCFYRIPFVFEECFSNYWPLNGAMDSVCRVVALLEFTSRLRCLSS